jgi:multisubunit Na+/H+ antiporter MnhE subunit
MMRILLMLLLIYGWCVVVDEIKNEHWVGGIFLSLILILHIIYIYLKYKFRKSDPPTT